MMWKKAALIAGAIALLMVPSIWVANVGREARADEPTPQASFRNSLTVTGHGKLYAPSDEAMISLGVRTVRPTASRAMGDNSTAMSKTIGALKQAGLSDDEVKTGNISLYPQQDYREGKEPKITGYTAENRIVVRTKKLDKLGAIIDSATKAGATDVSGLTFQLSEDSAARQDALTIAVKNARAKAGALAKELGVRLGKPIIMSEGIQATPPVLYEQAMRSGYALDAMAGAAPPVMPQDIQVNADVTISFEMN